MSDFLCKINKKLTQGSLICILLAYLTAFIHGIIIFMGMDYGYFVVVDTYLARAGILLSVISLILILTSREYFKGLIFVGITLTLSVPFIYSDYQCYRIVDERIEAKKKYSGEYNLRLLGKELIKYAKANDGCLPPAEQWCDCLMEFNSELTKNNFRHPQAPAESVCNFAFNPNLAGLDPENISDKTVLLFEADGEWNLNGTVNLLRPRFDGEQDVFVLYIDGTVRSYWFEEEKIREFKSRYGQVRMCYEALRWQP